MPRYAQQAAPATVEPPSEEAIQTLMVRIRFQTDRLALVHT